MSQESRSTSMPLHAAWQNAMHVCRQTAVARQVLCRGSLAWLAHAPFHTPGSAPPFGADAQAAWFGHPSHAEALPACSLLVPGHSATARRAPQCVRGFA
eukprot:365747-Chlamydomonas_euryale.AAC.42